MVLDVARFEIVFFVHIFNSHFQTDRVSAPQLDLDDQNAWFAPPRLKLAELLQSTDTVETSHIVELENISNCC